MSGHFREALMLDQVLAYLKDPGNRAVLAWLGAGVVMIATGLWAIIKFFASKPTVRADNGSVAVGGDNTNSPITMGNRPDSKSNRR